MEKVSLILTTYNSKENFLKTYKSIRQQDYPDIEIVVADGGSTDGTAEEIRKCAGREAGRMRENKALLEDGRRADPGRMDACLSYAAFETGDL